MDKTQARFLLRCCRSGTTDEQDEAFQEARQSILEDPDLQEWYHREMAFDRECRDKLQQFPVPTDLRANLIAAQRAQQSQAFRPTRQMVMGIAAALVMTLGALFLLGQFLHPAPLTASDFARHAVLADEHGNDPIFLSENLDAKREWLSRHNAPSEWVLPADLSKATGQGCRTVAVKGNTVTVIGFKLACGNDVTVYVISRQALSQATPPGELVLNEEGRRSVARWCDGKFYYVAVSQVPLNRLKDLL